MLTELIACNSYSSQYQFAKNAEEKSCRLFSHLRFYAIIPPAALFAAGGVL